MKNKAAEAYREMHIRSASPLGVIVMLHEAALKSLREAREAVARGDVEGRVNAVNHVLAVIGELHASLNLDHGEASQRLERFYVVMRGQVLEAGMKASDTILRRLELEFTLQRDAWVKVQQDVEKASGVPTTPLPAVVAPPAVSPAPGSARQTPELANASWKA